MTGIAAMYDRTCASAGQEDIQALLAAIRHRGPSESVWFGPGMALGERLLPSTPEALHEGLPLSVCGARYQVAFDGRLDNRDDLLSAIGISYHGPATDPDLVVLAYEKWGTDCVRTFVGDFAFVLWDSVARKLLAARDQRGFRPLFYAHAGRWLLFGSEARQLLACPAVSGTRDELFLACQLTGAPQSPGRTPYASISEVPPGHYLTVENDRMELREYWRFTRQATLRYRRFEDYVEHFESVFGEAVLAASRSLGTPSLLFSGGLDSSYILARLRDHAPSTRALHAFVERSAGMDERAYARVVASSLDIELDEVDVEDCWSLSSRYLPASSFDQPNITMQAALMVKMSQAAASKNTTVLIDGIGGDEIMTGTSDYIADLVRAGRLVQAIREGRSWAQTAGVAWTKVLFKSAILPFTPSLIRRGYRSVRGRQPVSQLPPWINGPSLQAMGLRPALTLSDPTAMRDRGADLREVWSSHLRDGVPTLGWRERWASLPYGIENRSPFWDLRVIELCARMPAWVLRSAGGTKALLRQAMLPRLPRQVVERQDKGAFDDLLNGGLLNEERQRVHTALTGPLATLPYLKTEPLHQELDIYGRTLHPWWSPLWRAITAGLWLRNEDVRTRRNDVLARTSVGST